MNNEEKAEEIAKDLLECCKDRKSIYNLYVSTSAYAAAMKMAEWKDEQLEQLIEKAVEWLKENTSCYASFDDDIISDTENKNNFINAFKQTMKE